MSFYEGRKNSEYYAIVREILDDLGPAESIMDVGSWDSPVATWGDFRKRYTVDTRERPELPGVTKLVGEWPAVAGQIGTVSIVTCLQVLEHIRDVRAFAETLFTAARKAVVISVPWMWPTGACEYHVHDPIDRKKLEWMVGRSADRLRVTEQRSARMVASYIKDRGMSNVP